MQRAFLISCFEWVRGEVAQLWVKEGDNIYTSEPRIRRVKTNERYRRLRKSLVTIAGFELAPIHHIRTPPTPRPYPFPC